MNNLETVCFNNARVVLCDAVEDTTVLIEDGSITSVGGPVCGLEVDCNGDYLMPGIIDLHTDNLEKHYFPRPEIDWHPVSASIVHDGLCTAVGVTTAYDAVTIGSYWAKESRMENNLRKLITGMQLAVEQELLKANHMLHLRCEVTSDNLHRMLDEFADVSAVGMLSMMDHTPGQRQYPNLQKYRDRWADEGMTEDEVERHIEMLHHRQQTVCPPNRQFVAEKAAVLSLPLASHDDAKTEHIAEAKTLGSHIAEFPTTMEAAQQARAAGLAVVMGAPNLVRGGSYSGNVSTAAVAQEGLLDVLASDYVPRGLLEGAFLLNKPPFNWELPKALRTITSNPAEAAGLSDRGMITPGKRADLVTVSEVAGWPLVRSVWVSGHRVV